MQLKELFHNFSYRRLLVIKILFSWEKGHNIRFMGSGRFFTHSGAVTLIAPLEGRDYRINTKIVEKKFTLRSDWLQNVTDIHRDIFTPASSSAIKSIPRRCPCCRCNILGFFINMLIYFVAMQWIGSFYNAEKHNVTL